MGEEIEPQSLWLYGCLEDIDSDVDGVHYSYTTSPMDFWGSVDDSYFTLNLAPGGSAEFTLTVAAHSQDHEDVHLFVGFSDDFDSYLDIYYRLDPGDSWTSLSPFSGPGIVSNHAPWSSSGGLYYADIDTGVDLVGENWDTYDASHPDAVGNPEGKSYSCYELAEEKAKHSSGSYVDVFFRVENPSSSGPVTEHMHFDARATRYDDDGSVLGYEWNPKSHDMTGIVNVVPTYLFGSLGAVLVPGALLFLRKRR